MNKMIKRITTILTYLASLSLVIFYLGILWSSRSPEVSFEYKHYYITKQLNQWPKDGGLNYPLNNTIGLTSGWEEITLSKCRGGSWGALEADGCWTYSDASVFLCGLPEQNLTFLMTYSQTQPDAIVTFSSKGQILGKFDTNDLLYAQQMEVELPPTILENGELELSITSSWKNASAEPIYGTKVTGVRIYDPNK